MGVLAGLSLLLAAAPQAASAAAFDVTPPPPPVIAQPLDGALIGNVPLVFTGTAEPDASILVFLDGSIITTAADSFGNWTTASTVFVGSEGAHSAYAMAFDAAGNTSDPSAAIAFTVDPVDPDAPLLTAPAQGSRTSDTTPTVTGTAEALSTVTVYIDSAAAGMTTANGAGAWSFTSATLAEGPHTAYAKATDAAANVSPASATRTFTIDTTAPAAPSITTPAGGARVGDLTPTISGTTEAGATVTIEIDGVPVGTATANGSGVWTFTTTTDLTEGAHTVQAKATDVAGNVSPLSPASSFTVDVTAPGAPLIATPVNGATTTDNTPTISGTSEAGATVTVRLDGTALTPVAADGAGNWSLTTAVLADGAHAVTAVAADAAGNLSAASSTTSFSVDATAPVAPVIATPVDGATIGEGRPMISGTADVGSTVQLMIDGGAPVSITATAGGAWSYRPPSDLSVGLHVLTAVAVDPIGNVSPVSATVRFTYAPVTIATTSLPAGQVGVGYAANLLVTGGVAPYSLTVTGGALPAGLSLSSTGVLSGTPTEGGAFSFTVTAVDASTGAGSNTASQTIVLTVSGSTIAITPNNLPAATRGVAYSQALTSSGGVAPYSYEVVSGALPAGLILSTTGQISGTPTVTGAFAFQVRAADSAGGTGPYSGTANLTLTVSAANLTVTPTTLPEVLAGTTYSQQMQATGGQGGYSFAVTAGTLPQGITLSTAGALSGRPTTAGSFVFTITATDGFGNTGAVALTLKVAGRPDPSTDPDVRGLNTAQAEATRRLAGTQMANFSRRLEALHHGAEGRRSVALDLSLDAHAFTPLDETERVMGELSQVLGRSHGLGLTDARDFSDREALTRMATAGRGGETDKSGLGASPDGRLSAGSGERSVGPSTGPRFWTGGAISLGERDATTRTAELSVTTSGISAGIDVSVNDDLDLGVGVGFGQENADVGVDVSRMEAKSWTGAAYGSWRPVGPLFVDGMLGYGQLNFDLRRRAPVNGDLMFGEREGSLWFGSLAAGSDRRFGDARLLGYGRLEVVDAELDAYAETGSALWALSYEARSVTSLQGTVGLGYERVIRRGQARWTPGGRMELRHEFADADAQGMRYADWLDGPGYSIAQEGWGRTRLNLGLSLGYQGDDGLSWFGEYEGGFSGDETSASFRIRVAKPF